MFLHKTALVAHLVAGTGIRAQDVAQKLQSLQGGQSGESKTSSNIRQFSREFNVLLWIYSLKPFVLPPSHSIFDMCSLPYVLVSLASSCFFSLPLPLYVCLPLFPFSEYFHYLLPLLSLSSLFVSFMICCLRLSLSPISLCLSFICFLLLSLLSLSVSSNFAPLPLSPLS